MTRPAVVAVAAVAFALLFTSVARAQQATQPAQPPQPPQPADVPAIKYDKEGKPCPGCDCDARQAKPSVKGRGVKRFVQGGRSTFYCPKCQR